MEIMLAYPTPFALTLPGGIVVETKEELDSVAMLPMPVNQIPVSAIETDKSTIIQDDNRLE